MTTKNKFTGSPDPRPIKDIYEELRKESVSSGKEITQVLLVELLSKKHLTLVSLSNP